jgi:hypothetical protein
MKNFIYISYNPETGRVVGTICATGKLIINTLDQIGFDPKNKVLEVETDERGAFEGAKPPEDFVVKDGALIYSPDKEIVLNRQKKGIDRALREALIENVVRSTPYTLEDFVSMSAAEKWKHLFNVSKALVALKG